MTTMPPDGNLWFASANGAGRQPDAHARPSATEGAHVRVEQRSAPWGGPPYAQPTEPSPARYHRPALHPQDAALLRRSLDELAPVASEATGYFYSLLFVRNPELRSLFPLAMDVQRDRLFHALLTAAGLAEHPARFTGFLSQLGRGHRKYGTSPDQYPVFGECLLAAVSRWAPLSWDAATQSAWISAYTAISQTMIDAAAEEARHAPAWWHAEIVDHRRRTPDVAEITLRTDRGYPFRAGQYAPVETPWWPRVWRHYSFASAQRGDGLLTFHVKAVAGGWVSTSLVRRAHVGDVLRLGAPSGTMTVDHGDESGLLCLGGGTGIAPIRALIEEIAVHGGRRPVEVFYGAHNRDDLYDLAELRIWEQRLGWLAVRPVIAAPPGSNGALPGLLPDAVRRFGPWHAFDGYLAGPPGLIRSGAEALLWSGIPQGRIRHDAVAELTGAG
ncbi:globin domain-containing protein [Streptomyces xiaopingdaonensis]|uniref:globin domain-containing protein n=1 Tax=Streptomyces xiaopingdaonensis TaxID=1565415 RepID=UPI000316497E|nr:globin domain-containing protein [Streptomyces xiaopingdaonensis]